MATKVITLSDKTLTSSYNAYNDAFGNTSLDTPSIAYYGNTTIDLTANGIPAGSTINGVVLYALYTSSLHGYSIRDCSINGTTAHTGTWASGNTTLNHTLIREFLCVQHALQIEHLEHQLPASIRRSL